MSPRGKIIIYTDGGSRGNPGPAAIGVVLKDSSGVMIKSYGSAIGVATNNEAEYSAVVFALQKAKALMGGARSRRTSVSVYMDSQLVARQLSGEYKIEEDRLVSHFIKIWNLKIDFYDVSFAHVPREKNREADRMVNEALDKEQQGLFPKN